MIVKAFYVPISIPHDHDEVSEDIEVAKTPGVQQVFFRYRHIFHYMELCLSEYQKDKEKLSPSVCTLPLGESLGDYAKGQYCELMMKSIVHEMKFVLKTSISEVNKLLTAYGIDFTVDDMKQGYQVRIKKGDYETTSPSLPLAEVFSGIELLCF